MAWKYQVREIKDMEIKVRDIKDVEMKVREIKDMEISSQGNQGFGCQSRWN